MHLIIEGLRIQPGFDLVLVSGSDLIPILSVIVWVYIVSFNQMGKISEDLQLQIFGDLTHLIETNYVYPNYNGKDWNEIRSRYQDKIEAGLDTQSFYDQMHARVDELGDDHSFFLSPAEVQESEAELKGD